MASLLIEPMDVTIEQLDLDNTPFPTGVTGRKFPANNVQRKSAFTIPAQVVFGDRDIKGHHMPIGTTEKTKGYIVVEYDDLKNLGIEIKKGDKLTKITSEQGEMNVDFYFQTGMGDPAAHLGGAFKLVRLLFQDREIKES